MAIMMLGPPINPRKKRVHRAKAPTPEKLQAAKDQHNRDQEFELTKLGLIPKAEIDTFIDLRNVNYRAHLQQLDLPLSATNAEQEIFRTLTQAHEIAPYNRFIRSLFTQFIQRGSLTDKQYEALRNTIAKEQAAATRIENVACPHCGGHLGMEVGVIRELNKMDAAEEKKSLAERNRFKKLL